MTENERQEMLKDIKDGYIDAWDNFVIDELFEQIEREHEEIQQYRAIGTVKGYEDAIKSSMEYYNLMKEYKAKVQKYEAIGAIEELQELKEKSVHIVTGEWIDTQPQHNNGYYKNAHVCSNCNDYYTTEYDEMKFCPNCGAKITET